MFKKFVLSVLSAAVMTAPSVDYSAVFRNMGYASSPEPIEIVEVNIPVQWDAVYENYNALQKQGGFDLAPYRGKTCRRYTYSIPEQFARGNVLVCDGEIIGGDICSITIDGIMIPIEKDKLE